MSSIKIDSDEIEKNISKIEQIVQRREECNNRLEKALENLSDVETNGFIEEIIKKIEDHIEDVHKVQIENIEYRIDALNNIVDNFEELDNNVLKVGKC